MPLYDGTGTLDIFNVHPTDLGLARIDFLSRTVECWLWTGPAPEATWRVGSDVNNEIAANDYTRTALPDQSWVEVGKLARLVSSPVDLPPNAASSFAATGYILILRVGADTTSPVLTWGYLDGSLQDEKTVIDPELLRITPGANGWYDVFIV